MDINKIQELFFYKDGNLYWKISPSRSMPAGKKAGTLMQDGYIAIRYKQKGYKAHRLIWLYHNGGFEKETIDHINGNRSDNRIENLRQATQKENAQHKTKSKGYHLCKKNNKYQAQVEVNGKKNLARLF